jgi:hypothetical protein
VVSKPTSGQIAHRYFRHVACQFVFVVNDAAVLRPTHKPSRGARRRIDVRQFLRIEWQIARKR